MTETPDEDLCIELVYRWGKRLRAVGHAQGLCELRAEIQRFGMTPEAIKEKE